MKIAAIVVSMLLAFATPAAAQSWQALPLDHNAIFQGIEFVTRHGGADWYSERASWMDFENGVFSEGNFDLFKGSFVDGNTVRAFIYAVGPTSCDTGMVSLVAGGAGTSMEDLQQHIFFIGGAEHVPAPGSPVAIRFEQFCQEMRLLSFRMR